MRSSFYQVKTSKADAATIAQRRKAVQHQVQQTLELVKHSSSCFSETCTWHKCDTIKKVIAHMKVVYPSFPYVRTNSVSSLIKPENCEWVSFVSQDVATWRQPHDCKHCRQMGKILKYHASLCKEPECNVYMCKELKDAMRRIAQRQAAQEQHRAQAYQVDKKVCVLLSLASCKWLSFYVGDLAASLQYRWS